MFRIRLGGEEEEAVAQPPPAVAQPPPAEVESAQRSSSCDVDRHIVMLSSSCWHTSFNPIRHTHPFLRLFGRAACTVFTSRAPFCPARTALTAMCAPVAATQFLRHSAMSWFLTQSPPACQHRLVRSANKANDDWCQFSMTMSEESRRKVDAPS